MLNWRETYYKHFTFGMSIAAALHLAVLLFVFLFSRNAAPEEKVYYYYNSYTAELAERFSNDTSRGGGGSFGNGIEEIRRGISAPKTISGIPVPSSEPDNIEFGKITSLDEPKDTLTRAGSGSGTGSGTGNGSGSGSGAGDGSEWGAGYKALPFIPRQILEVVPQNVEGVKGSIRLVLKIGTDGYVREDKLIYNSTNNQACLQNTIEAARKSRWEKIKIEGKQIQYWIEKTYRFN